MWVRIRDVLAERIASGVYKPGGRLPVRCDIATEFGLSSGQPVSRALGELGARGLIRSIRNWDLVPITVNAVIGACMFGLPSKI